MAKSIALTVGISAVLDKSFTNVRSQIEKAFSGIDANINVQLGKNSIRSIDSLNKKIEQLRTNLDGINSASARAAAGISNIAPSINKIGTVSSRSSSATGKLNANLNSITKNAKASQGALDGLASQIELSARRFAAFAVASRTFISFTQSLEQGIQKAIEYQKELVRLKQVGGDTASTIRGISNEVRRLSTGFGVSSDELIKTSVTLRQAGFSINDVKKSLDALAKSALAPNFESLEQTTEGLIAINSQFKGSIEENIKALSKINAVASAYAVESADLITGVQKVGSAFETAGGSIEELIGILTAVRSTTRESADTIATGLRTIIARTQRLGAAEELKKLGINIRASAEEAQNLGIQVGDILPVFERFRKISIGLQSVSEFDPKFAQAVEIVGGVRQLSKTIPLIKEFGKAQEAANLARRSGNSLDKDAAIAQEQLATQLTKLNEKLFKLFETFGRNKSIQDFVGLLVKGADAALDLAEKLEPLAPILLSIATVASVKLGAGIFNSFRNGIPVNVTGGGSGLSIARKNTGGIVPGPRGVNRDVVPAMLTPGEFILRKEAVNRLGLNNVQRLNTGGEAKRVRSPNPIKMLGMNIYERFAYMLNPGSFPRTKFIRGEETFPKRSEKLFDEPVRLDYKYQPRKFEVNLNKNAASELLRGKTVDLKKEIDPQMELASILNPGRFPKRSFAFEKNSSIDRRPMVENLLPGLSYEDIDTPISALNFNKRAPRRFYGRKRATGFRSQYRLPSPEPGWSLREELSNFIAPLSGAGIGYGLMTHSNYLANLPNDPVELATASAIGLTAGAFTNYAIKSGVVGGAIGDILRVIKEDAKGIPAALKRFGRSFIDPPKYNDGRFIGMDSFGNPMYKEKFKKFKGRSGRFYKFQMGGKVPAMLTPGELRIPAPLARRIGYGKLNQLNSGTASIYKDTPKLREVLSKIKSTDDPTQRYAMKRVFIGLGGDPSLIRGYAKGGKVDPTSIEGILQSAGIKLTRKQIKEALKVYATTSGKPQFKFPTTAKGGISTVQKNDPFIQQKLLDTFLLYNALGTSGPPEKLSDLFSNPLFAAVGLKPTQFIKTAGIAPPLGSSGKPLIGAALNNLKMTGSNRSFFAQTASSLANTANFINNFSGASLGNIISGVSKGKLAGASITGAQIPLNLPEFTTLGISNLGQLSAFANSKGVKAPADLASLNVGQNQKLFQNILSQVRRSALGVASKSGVPLSRFTNRGKSQKAGSEILGDLNKGDLSGLYSQIFDASIIDPNTPTTLSKQQAIARRRQGFLNDVFNNGQNIVANSNNPKFSRSRASFNFEGREAQLFNQFNAQLAQSNPELSQRRRAARATRFASDRVSQEFITSRTSGVEDRRKMTAVFNKLVKNYEDELKVTKAGLSASERLAEARKSAATVIDKSIKSGAFDKLAVTKRRGNTNEKVYEYTALNASGQQVVGQISARDKKTAEKLAAEKAKAAGLFYYGVNKTTVARSRYDLEDINIRGLRESLPMFGGRPKTFAGRAFSGLKSLFGESGVVGKIAGGRFGSAISNPLTGIGLGILAEQVGPTDPNDPKQRGSARFSGALSGAGVGLSLGALAGPYGAAIGGFVGAIVGAVNSVKDFDENLKKVEFDKLINSYRSRVGFALNDNNISAGDSSLIIKTISQINQEGSRRFGSDLAGKQNFLTENLSQLNADQIISQIVSDKSVKDIASFRRFGGGLGEQLIYASAIQNRIDPSEQKKQIESVIKNEQERRAELEKARKFEAAVIDSTILFNELSRAVSSAKSQFDIGTERLGAFNVLLDNRFDASAPFKGGFGETARLVGSAFSGSGQGGRIATLATDFDKSVKELPTIIRSIAGSSGLQDKFDEAIKGLLGDNSEVATRLSLAFGTVSEEILKKGTDDIEKTVRELAENSFPGLIEAIENGKDALSGALDAFVNGLETLQAGRARARDLRVSNVELGVSRFQNLFEANRVNPSLGLSSAFVNRPFIARQQLLTGLSGASAINANAIGNRLNGVRSEIAQEENRRLGGTLSVEEIFKSTEKLVGLRESAKNLESALENLADASSLAAASQERIAALEGERGARIGLAEQILTANPLERSQIFRTAEQARISTFTGLDSFNPQVIKDILEFFRSAGEITFANGLSGNEIANKLIENSAIARSNPLTNTFGINQQIAGERGNVDAILKNAQDANNQLRSAIEADSSKFFNDLKLNQKEFLNNLQKSFSDALADSVERGRQKNIESIRANESALAGGRILFGGNDANLSKIANIAGSGQLADLAQKQREFTDLQRNILTLDSKLAGLDLNNPRTRIDPNQIQGLFLSSGFGLDAADSFLKDIQKSQTDKTRLDFIRRFSDERSKTIGFQESFDQIAKNNNISRDTLSKAIAISLDEKSNEGLRKVAEAIINAGGSIGSLINKINTDKKALGFAKGGFVPGSGNRDTVKAKLTPGEFVVNKGAASKNSGILQYLNNGGSVNPFTGVGKNVGNIRSIITREILKEKDPRRRAILNEIAQRISNLSNEDQVLGDIAEIYNTFLNADNNAGYSSRLNKDIGIIQRYDRGIRRIGNPIFSALAGMPYDPVTGDRNNLNSPGSGANTQRLAVATDFERSLYNIRNTPIGGLVRNDAAAVYDPIIERIRGQTEQIKSIRLGMIEEGRKFAEYKKNLPEYKPLDPAIANYYTQYNDRENSVIVSPTIARDDGRLQSLRARLAKKGLPQYNSSPIQSTQPSAPINQPRALNESNRNAQLLARFNQGDVLKRESLRNKELIERTKKIQRNNSELSVSERIKSLREQESARNKELLARFNPQQQINNTVETSRFFGFGQDPNFLENIGAKKREEESTFKKEVMNQNMLQMNAPMANFNRRSRFSYGDYARAVRQQYAMMAQQARYNYYGGYYANGGSVFKPRGSDTVPAMLTPGEFIVNAKAAKKFEPQLKKMNAQYRADGGFINNASGGSVDLSNFGKDLIKPLNDFNASAALLYKTFSELNSKISELANAVANMSIKIEGRQTVDVVLNGGAVLASILPEVRAIVNNSIREAINAKFEEMRFNGNPT